MSPAFTTVIARVETTDAFGIAPWFDLVASRPVFTAIQ